MNKMIYTESKIEKILENLYFLVFLLTIIYITLFFNNSNKIPNYLVNYSNEISNIILNIELISEVSRSYGLYNFQKLVLSLVPLVSLIIFMIHFITLSKVYSFNVNHKSIFYNYNLLEYNRNLTNKQLIGVIILLIISLEFYFGFFGNHFNKDQILLLQFITSTKLGILIFAILLIVQLGIILPRIIFEIRQRIRKFNKSY